MTDDARFADGDEAPLRLRALDTEDLAALSGLVQDAVFPASEMTWDRRARRFGLLLNRFRWERPGKSAERVQSVLAVEEVTGLASQGIDPRDKETVLSLLSLSFEAGDDGAGRLVLTLAGDGAIGVTVEALDVVLRDVTRPYLAPSGKRPAHPD
ncbi:MAG: DUF2948 family protein [Paracoccaceae bacterium]|nr:DUF2948 family protein [Paracoccaceae bacterium]